MANRPGWVSADTDPSMSSCGQSNERHAGLRVFSPRPKIHRTSGTVFLSFGGWKSGQRTRECRHNEFGRKQGRQKSETRRRNATRNWCCHDAVLKQCHFVLIISDGRPEPGVQGLVTQHTSHLRAVPGYWPGCRPVQVRRRNEILQETVCDITRPRTGKLQNWRPCVLSRVKAKNVCWWPGIYRTGMISRMMMHPKKTGGTNHFSKETCGPFVCRVQGRRRWCARPWSEAGGSSSRTVTWRPAGCRPWRDSLNKSTRKRYSWPIFSVSVVSTFVFTWRSFRDAQVWKQMSLCAAVEISTQLKKNSQFWILSSNSMRWLRW